jgi:hypothetical protein
MNKYRRLVDEYAYPGFRSLSKVKIHSDKPDARIITLRRRQKKMYVAAAVRNAILFTTERSDLYVTFPVEMPKFILRLRYAGSNAKSAAK